MPYIILSYLTLSCHIRLNYIALYYVNISHVVLQIIYLFVYFSLFLSSSFSFHISTFYFIYLFIFIVSSIYAILHMFIISYYLPLSHLDAHTHAHTHLYYLSVVIWTVCPLSVFILVVWCTCPSCHLVFHIISPIKKKNKKSYRWKQWSWNLWNKMMRTFLLSGKSSMWSEKICKTGTLTLGFRISFTSALHWIQGSRHFTTWTLHANKKSMRILSKKSRYRYVLILH